MAAALAGRTVTVDVPATTANLGAGFDVLAMALDLRNMVTVTAVEGGTDLLTITVRGEGAGRLPADRRNRFVRALESGLRELGLPQPGVTWHIEMDNEIPLSRGLGSSAAATVAGFMAAAALAGEDRLTRQRMLGLAAGMEGHPDNAAAALWGGFVVVVSSDGRPDAVRFEPPDRLLCVLFIPERPLSTRAMRAALPASVPFADAVHNVGAASAAVAAMASGRLDLLASATDDRLHEPYRAMIYRELPRMTSAAREAGALGACLSGAGSTIIAFVEDERRAREVESAMVREAGAAGLAGRARTVRPRAAGATIQES
jgi:homoserine kinase